MIVLWPLALMAFRSRRTWVNPDFYGPFTSQLWPNLASTENSIGFLGNGRVWAARRAKTPGCRARWKVFQIVNVYSRYRHAVYESLRLSARALAPKALLDLSIPGRDQGS